MSLAVSTQRILATLSPIHPLSDETATRLATWTRVLSTWNRAQRLVGWGTADDLLHKGLADCWRGRALLGESFPWTSLLDVGSGSGLPGLIVAAAFPDAEVHLVEARRKRAAFLREVARAMELPGVEVHQARSEELRERLSLHGCLFVSRAFAAPTAAAEEGCAWNAAAVLVGTSIARLEQEPWPPPGWRRRDGNSWLRTSLDHHELLVRAAL